MTDAITRRELETIGQLSRAAVERGYVAYLAAEFQKTVETALPRRPVSEGDDPPPAFGEVFARALVNYLTAMSVIDGWEAEALKDEAA
jgi:hypothetical protein